MAVFDLSMQKFLVPGLRNYQPKVGKMKDLGVSLTTLEVVNNMATPYTRVFTLADGDLVTGPVEADCTVIYRTDSPQQIDFSALKGSPGVRVTVIHEGSGSLEVVLTSGLTNTTAKVEPSSPVMFLYPKYNAGVQTGWLASQGGVSTDAPSGGSLTRRFTHEVSDSAQLKLMITQPDTFFTGHASKDVSVVIRSGDYKLVKPYKDTWGWFDSDKLGQVTVVCEDNVNISLTYSFDGYTTVDDVANSIATDVVYFTYGYDSRVDWYGGRFGHYLLASDFVVGSQSTGGAGSPVSYTPFGQTDRGSTVVGLFGNKLPPVENKSYMYQFFGTDFYQVAPLAVQTVFALVFDCSLSDSSNNVLGYYWRLVFHSCRVFQLCHSESIARLTSLRKSLGGGINSGYTPLFSNLGGDSAYPNATGFGGPAFVGGEFLPATTAGSYASTFSPVSTQTWGMLCSNYITSLMKADLIKVLDKVQSIFTDLTVVGADDIWEYDYDTLTTTSFIYPPLRGGLQDTNYVFTGSDSLSLTQRLMTMLTKGHYQ